MQPLEDLLAQKPTVKVPTVTIDGATDPLKPGGTAEHARMFVGLHEHRVVEAGQRRRNGKQLLGTAQMRDQWSMSHSLKVSDSTELVVVLQTTIYSLSDRGWSRRQIARELGIDRETGGPVFAVSKTSPFRPTAMASGANPRDQRSNSGEHDGDRR